MTGPVADIFTLTPAQSGMLVSTLREPEPGLYVVQMRFSLTGRVDLRRLTEAWQALVARHEMLRTAIIWDKSSSPVNVVVAAAQMPIEHVKLPGLSADARATAVADFLTRDRRRGFDLQSAPLSRITLLDFDGGEREMVWTHHHLIIDGWSTAHVMGELWRLYVGDMLSGDAPGFRGFASRIATASPQRRSDSEAHWAHRIGGSAARIAVDRPQNHAPADPWTDCERSIAAEQLDRWDAAARRHGTTRSTLVHAGWAMALRDAGLGPDELTFGTVADSRGAEGAEVVGLCVASTPLRVTFPRIPVADWLRQISVERAISQELAGNLADHRRWSHDGAEVPFRYILAVEGYAHAGLSAPDTGDELTVRFLGVRESTEFALTAGLPAGDPRLKLTIDTRRIALDDATALLEQWAEYLDEIAAAPSDLPVTELVAANAAPTAGRTLPERVRALAAEHPERPAFRDAQEILTLEALVRAADQVAARLRADGLRAGDRVGVLSDGTAGVPIATIAILSAGGVVVPLDPRHPSPYRRAVIEDADLRCVLTPHQDVRPDWAGTSVHAISDLRANAPAEVASVGNGRAGVAFLVFDGGSALRPHGASYDHSDVMGSASDAADRLNLAGDDWVMPRTGGATLSPWEMWIAPMSGGCTVLASATPDEIVAVEGRDLLPVAGIALDPADVEHIIAGQPGVASCIVRVEPDDGLHAVVTAGTPLSARDLTRTLRSALPERLVPQVALAEDEAAPDAARQLQCEQDVRRLWSQVLEVSDVPPDTPFFDLGGDSLLLFAVLTGLRRAGWTEVTMTDLFAYPTVRSLSRHLTRSAPVAPATSQQTTRSRRDAVAARRERRNP